MDTVETCTQCGIKIEKDDEVWSRNAKSKDDWRPYHAGHEPQVDRQITSLSVEELARMEAEMRKYPKEPCSVCGGMFWTHHLMSGYWNPGEKKMVEHEPRCTECNDAAHGRRRAEHERAGHS